MSVLLSYLAELLEIVSDFVLILTFPLALAKIKLLLILSKFALILFAVMDMGPLRKSFTSPSLLAILLISSNEIKFFENSLNFLDSIDWLFPFKMMNLFLKLYVAKLDFAVVFWFIIITLPFASMSVIFEFYVFPKNAVILSAFIEKFPFDALAFPEAT